jgi:hypothetical protein
VSIKARTDRDGYVHLGELRIGKVQRSNVVAGWHAYVEHPGKVMMRHVGHFTTKREAVSEVTIMREV